METYYNAVENSRRTGISYNYNVETPQKEISAVVATESIKLIEGIHERICNGFMAHSLAYPTEFILSKELYAHNILENLEIDLIPYELKLLASKVALNLDDLISEMCENYRIEIDGNVDLKMGVVILYLEEDMVDNEFELRRELFTKLKSKMNLDTLSGISIRIEDI
ncbi:hypothetical protein [Methanococcus sp. CF]